MVNRDITEEDINTIKLLYLNTKPAIISAIKKIVVNESKELTEEKFGQVHSEESLIYSKKISKEVVQEFNLFIESRAKKYNINNINQDHNFSQHKLVESYERDIQTIKELDKLLETADDIEKRKYRLSQRIFSSLAIAIAIPIISIIIWQPFFDTLSFSLFVKVFLILVVCLLFTLSILTADQAYEDHLKEKRAFRKLSGIIQEVIPFYFKNMTVLEKANFEVKLARMDISVPDGDS